uniref:CSON005138 protein n=1 Tax=Culicoides sonorensis TaxID=179676 RepID=A0A336LUV2_CULSO
MNTYHSKYHKNTVDPLIEFYSKKPKILLPQDLTLNHAYKVYGPSFQSINFLSEEGRTIYAESCKTVPNKNEIERLQDMCIETLSKNFNGGRLDERLNFDNLASFGEKLDVNLPLEKLFELVCDTFWKRVVKAKSHYPVDYLNSLNDDQTNWKEKGIELKFAEIIQNTEPERWEIDFFSKLSVKAQHCIKSLEIIGLKPLKSHEHRYRDQNLDYPPIEVCHHGSLSFLNNLVNLTSLSLRFAPGSQSRSYNRGSFECSYDDIQNLSNGIKNLSSLKCLKITDSRLDSIKMDALLNSFNASVQLTHIDFSSCNLNEDAAVSLGFFIAKSSSLKHIELQGNYLDDQGARCIAYGLQNTRSTDLYLGLARNPISNHGIEDLGAGLFRGKNVTELNLTGIDIKGEGLCRISHLIEMESPLKILNISCIKFNETAAQMLVTKLRDNYRITGLECRGCDLSEEHEFQIRTLVKRNQFYIENPCMLKTYFTKDDEKEIEAWLKRVKHPLLLAAEEARKKETAVEVRPQIQNSVSNELKEKVTRSTASLLGIESLSKTFSVEALPVTRKNVNRYDTKRFVSPHKIFKDPKIMDITSHLTTFTSSDLSSPHYFN